MFMCLVDERMEIFSSKNRVQKTFGSKRADTFSPKSVSFLYEEKYPSKYTRRKKQLI